MQVSLNTGRRKDRWKNAPRNSIRAVIGKISALSTRVANELVQMYDPWQTLGINAVTTSNRNHSHMKHRLERDRRGNGLIKYAQMRP